jgi:hypothetical protein
MKQKFIALLTTVTVSIKITCARVNDLLHLIVLALLDSEIELLLRAADRG